MTNGWLGTDVTSVTLYDTSITGSNSDKLYVPGGVEVLFTLKEQSDGTLLLRYEIMKDTYSIHGLLSGTEEPVELSLSNRETPGTVVQTSVTGSSFELADLLPGEYLLTVSHPDCVLRSYTVRIVSSDVTVDVKVCRYGDVNGDGAVNLGDIARMFAHVRGAVLMADSYELQCADVDRNGMVNIGDVARCYAAVCDS